jgi:hypothetical protein
MPAHRGTHDTRQKLTENRPGRFQRSVVLDSSRQHTDCRSGEPD